MNREMWLRCAKPFHSFVAFRNGSRSPWLLLPSCSFSDTPHNKSKLAPLQERRMIDRFRLWAKGGDGGNGCSSLRRSRRDRHGRPDVSRWWLAATIAVVTGANRGIPFEIAHQLAMHGLSLTVILTSRDAAVSNEAAKVLQGGGLNVLVHQLDIVDLSSVKVFTEWLRQHYGGADILALEWVKSKGWHQVEVLTDSLLLVVGLGSGNGGRGGDVILECSPRLWDFSSLQHHIHAKSGGHGASKNKIGSRGSDKVVQVPVGTVIHLVEGEVPATVEKISSAALDPWEIPGTLDVDPSESAQKSSSTCTNEKERVETVIKSKLSSCIGKNVVESASTKKATRTLLTEPLPESLPCYKRPRCRTEDFDFWKVEGGIEKEGVETDSEMCESEWEEEKEETEHIEYNVAELTEPGQRVIIACGGEGGLGNVSSPKTSKKHNHIKDVVQKDNDFDGELSDDEPSSLSAGLPGSEVLLVLELKSIADVGLVGMPNAGKSTLLGAMSRAKPTVGHYAFTTLRPNLGNLNYDEFSVKVADIPGIIKGAHENRGLGHAFLRHIERTKVLAYVVDLAAALDGRKGIPPWEQLRDLILELELYSEGLSDRPSLVVANKIDEEGAEEVYEELKRRVSGVPVFPVCAVLEEGIPEVKECLRMLVNGGESYRLRLDGIMTESTN